MSHYRMNTKSVAHESTGGTLASIPMPVDPVGNASDCLTLQTVAPLQRGVRSNRRFSADALASLATDGERKTVAASEFWPELSSSAS
jgi:hypothetical protein